MSQPSNLEARNPLCYLLFEEPPERAALFVSGGAGGPRFFVPDNAVEERGKRVDLGTPLPDLAQEVEGRLESMGFELVEATWAGSPRRPILRIRMDLPDSVPGKGGVTVDQCAQVSRALESWLDEHPGIPERYTLEVSSPGVERPLVKEADWRRFRGQPVRVKGRGLPGDRGNVVDGEILGIVEDTGGSAEVELLLEDGEKLRIPFSVIQKAHLRFEWD